MTRFTFTIENATEGQEWSLERLSKLLLGIAALKAGLNIAVNPDADPVGELDSPDAALALVYPENLIARSYLEQQGERFLSQLDASEYDRRGKLCARGILQTYLKDEQVVLVELRRGSIEGILEELGRTIGSGIGWFFSLAFEPIRFRQAVIGALGNSSSTSERQRHRGLGIVEEGRNLITEAIDGPSPTITISTRDSD